MTNKRIGLKKFFNPFYWGSFFIPLIIMALVLWSQGVYWGSDTTILASDGFHQYVIFDHTVTNILHGEGSFFYSFTSGLGLNFYALMSYYLGSFFIPFNYFFDLASMPEAVYLFTLLKFGFIGLSAFYSFSRIYKTVNSYLMLGVSTSFTMMSFVTSQIELNKWLDVFILVPLILLGLHLLITEEKNWIYYLSLSCLFIQNYYFGYMTAIFLAIYFFIKLSWNPQQPIRKFLRFATTSLLAAITSLVMLLPTIIDLRTHGETLTENTEWFFDYNRYLDLIAKSFIGSYDTTKFDALPSIYGGLFILVTAVLFFTLRSIKISVKLAHLFGFSFFIASFYLVPLDLAWQGFHSPNMFLHRYAWLFVLLLTLTALETLSRLEEINPVMVLTISSILATLFLATVLSGKYEFLTVNHIFPSFSFLIIYTMLLWSLLKDHLPLHAFTLLLALFMVVEASANGYFNIAGLKEEWNFPSREGYERQMTEIENLVEWTEKQNDTFFRTERLQPQTGNDSMKFNYNGISQFSSIRNRSASYLLDKLGFKSSGSNLNLRYQNNTIIADALFAMKYNLSTETVSKYGFTEVNEDNGLRLYENTYASSLAILTPEVYSDFEISNNTLDNQANLLNTLSGKDYDYFTRLESSIIGDINQLNDKITTTETIDGTAILRFNIEVPAGTQLYVSMPNIEFQEDKENVEIEINGNRTSYSLDNTFSFFDLGYYEKAQTITAVFYFPGNSRITFPSANFYGLNTGYFSDALEVIQANQTTSTTKGNKVNIEYNSDNDSSLFITLPYDAGWTAVDEDGNPLTVRAAQDGLLLVDVPAGEHQVTLTFVPKGFYLGLGLSSLAFITFSTSEYIKRKRQKQHELEFY